MSPHARPNPRPPHRFPRVSGDEPQFMEAEEYIRTFSPRERG